MMVHKFCMHVNCSSVVVVSQAWLNLTFLYDIISWSTSHCNIMEQRNRLENLVWIRWRPSFTELAPNEIVALPVHWYVENISRANYYFKTFCLPELWKSHIIWVIKVNLFYKVYDFISIHLHFIIKFVYTGTGSKCMYL